MQPNALALKSLVEDTGLSFKENSTSWIFDCPQCQKRDKLYLRKTDGRFICWVCAEDGFKGKPEYALRELLGEPLSRIREQLYGVAFETRGDDVELEIEDFFGEEDEVPYVLMPLPRAYFPEDFYPIGHPFAAKGARYLAGRGITEEVARHYDLRYVPQEKVVVFPIVADGRLIGWQQRITYPQQGVDSEGEEWLVPKIETRPTALDRGRALMFQDNLKGSDHAVICEGPVDAVKAHLCGGNVATMGKTISQGQIEIIRDSGVKRVYLALDLDATKETSRLCREFSDLEVFQIKPPAGHDLGSLSMEAVLGLFREAEPIHESEPFIFLDDPYPRARLG